tara:strand:- start:542 stop:844 length:303 start_codon:yes stop_codon:yes gene_type:complete
VTFVITKAAIEREAGWNTHYYGLEPQKALQTEASFILTGRYIDHIDSPETESWLRQFLPNTELEVNKVKESFQKLQDSMIQTDEDRKARDAAYDEYIASL